MEKRIKSVDNELKDNEKMVPKLHQKCGVMLGC